MSYRFLSSWESKTQELGCTCFSPMRRCGWQSSCGLSCFSWAHLLAEFLRFLHRSGCKKKQQQNKSPPKHNARSLFHSSWRLSCIQHSPHVPDMFFAYMTSAIRYSSPLYAVYPLSPEANVLAYPNSGLKLNLTRHGEYYPSSTEPLRTACLTNWSQDIPACLIVLKIAQPLRSVCRVALTTLTRMAITNGMCISLSFFLIVLTF